ncbi:MAG: D-alanyl-D-alanine carboxypeptidase/D-alanyl-D-alanine-endopeptidase (penicillin-binding protein 4) [Verrucomicrobiales bacterium]|jgi:D-alanyl-D-alanine carboxypeptidase/D-alanyl-D-alanine-endopeptidase (penicillin-binding protein 4)
MVKNVIMVVLAGLVAVFGVLLVNREIATGPPAAEDPAETIPTPLQYAEARVDEMLDSGVFASTAIGFCLMDDQGEVLIARNASQAYIPASTLKTLTTVSALEILGPDFRFETPLLADGPISETGELVGDLMMAGSGDPTLDTANLANWVVALREAGLKEISGGIVGDATYFPEEIAGEFWNWGDVGNGYGSPVAGLNLNRNRFKAVLRPADEAGAAAVLIDVSPAVPDVQWVTRVRSGSVNDVMIYGGPRATQLVLRGSVKRGEDYEVMGAVPDPALFAASEFDRQLRAAGVGIGKPPSTVPFVQEAEPPRPGTTLLTHRSAPLSEIVRYINEVSDNHGAECLFRRLGEHHRSYNADSLIFNHWSGRGLDLGSCRLVDGSGLGRANFITALDLTRLQHLARRGPQGDTYYESLNAYYEGAFHFKIGAMSRIRCYTGYVMGESGREFTFSLMFNHYDHETDVSQWVKRILPSLRLL